ncbi:CPBP family intramembrane glutamic endopeptidase [Paenibacillus sp.]|uniref:CPBP family intramembrane glutamic endopeptidase n=1 Tax=Paenibacillus sp. TaxID=58172 RepID=UPI002811CEDC|nr:CPBP family intramembrane glutamic endopeptidase [Paenibacillus sp.]
MEVSSRNQWIILAMTACMVGVQFGFPSQITLLVPPTVIILAILFLYRRQIRSYQWVDLTRSNQLYNIFIALTHGLIAQAIGIVIIEYGFRIPEPDIGLQITTVVLISSTFFSAILEEVVYRKIIFSNLDRRIGFWGAAAISSLLFAVSHYNYAAHLGYFFLGMVWCYAYKKSGNLGVVIAAHTIFNAIYFVVRILQM